MDGKTHSNELICNNLDTDQLRDLQQIPIALNSQQECDGVEEVAKNQLDTQQRIVDVQITTPPPKKTINQTKEGENAK